MKKILLISLIMFMHLSLSALAEVNTLEQGRKAYESGDFDSARAIYQELADQGYQSFELYYNLGNTYYKLGELAGSILYYERAKKINPLDEDLLFNLGLVTSKITDKVTVADPGPLETLTMSLSSDAWGVISVLFFFLFVISLFLFFYMSSLTFKRFFLTALIIFILVSGITFFLGLYNRQMLLSDQGVVFAPAVTVTSAPGKTGKELFIIHEGLKVEILEASGEFLKIKLSDGNVGWIPKSDAEKI